MSNLIAAVDGAQMWDMRYKYPYDYTYKNEDGTDKNTVTYYSNASAKCVAPTAERAIALVKDFCPEAVILGVHHREGGEKNRVLIDPAVMPESQPTLTDEEREAIERAILELDGIMKEFIPTPVETRLKRHMLTLRGLLERTK